MKKVFRTSEVPHIWAQQKQKEGRSPKAGRNGSGSFGSCGRGPGVSVVFFKGPTLYSYGYHYPVGVFTGKRNVEGRDVVLLNSEKSSNTTNGVRHDAFQALHNARTFSVPMDGGSYGVSGRYKPGEDNTAFLKTSMEYLVKKCRDVRERYLKKGNLEHVLVARGRAYYYAQSGHILNSGWDTQSNALEFAKIFKVKMDRKTKKFLTDPLFTAEEQAAFQAKVDKFRNDPKRAARNEAAAKAREEKQKREAEVARRLGLEQLTEWLRYERRDPPYIGVDEVHLRVSPDRGEIQTSKGARIGIDAAKTLWACILADRPVHGVQLDHYTAVSFVDGVLTVGCHKIEIDEMNRIARELGWEEKKTKTEGGDNGPTNC